MGCHIGRPAPAGVQSSAGNFESSLQARPDPLDADRDWDAASGKAGSATVSETPRTWEVARVSQPKARHRSEENTLSRRANKSPSEHPSLHALRYASRLHRLETALRK